MRENTIITISREYGSGGRQIGKKLADELGIPFYDKEIIDMSAEKSGFDPNIIAHHEENIPNSFLYSVAMGSYYVGNLLPDQIYQVEYHVIREIAEKGSCVIVGRCANYILSDDFNCMNVFIHAPVEERRKRAVDSYGAAPQDAVKIVETIDRQRAKHSRHYTDINWGVAKNYHLSLDSGQFGIDGCVGIIKLAFEKR